MKVADGFEPGAVIGPLIDMKAVEKVEAHIADAVKKGAKVVTGGKRAAQGGSFFEPTVLTDVTTDMVISKEETFGPVAPLYRFKSEADAVKMANDTPTLTLPRSRGREGRGSPPISTAATSAASGASPRPSNTASSAATRASSRPRSLRSYRTDCCFRTQGSVPPQAVIVPWHDPLLTPHSGRCRRAAAPSGPAGTEPRRPACRPAPAPSACPCSRCPAAWRARGCRTPSPSSAR